MRIGRQRRPGDVTDDELASSDLDELPHLWHWGRGCRGFGRRGRGDLVLLVPTGARAYRQVGRFSGEPSPPDRSLDLLGSDDDEKSLGAAHSDVGEASLLLRFNFVESDDHDVVL